MAIATTPTFRTDAFVDGACRSAKTGDRFATENPATGQPLTDIAAGDAADIDLAVAAARRAFDDGRWSRRSPAERKAVLLRLADLIEANAEELAHARLARGGQADHRLSRGGPARDDQDVPLVRRGGRQALRLDRADRAGCARPDHPRADRRRRRRPAVELPDHDGGLEGGPGAGGRQQRWSSSRPSSPRSARSAWPSWPSEAGIPDGVFNVVPGLGETAGQALGRHLDVDVLSFTGSTEVGRLFLRYSSESNLKRVVLECGGKSPQVVMADAVDLDLVAEQVVLAGFANMGENCTCGSRLIVHRGVHDELLERIVAKTADWTVGDPQDPATRIGPMIEQPHLDKVLGYIETGREEGARVVVGGDRAMLDSGGYFVEPTVFDGVDNSMTIAREEIFGPVISTIPFDTEDEAPRDRQRHELRAPRLGLHQRPRHRDPGRAHVRAGTVSVNGYSEGDITTPFGGYKESGFGGRDKGLEAFDQYTEKKTIWISVKALDARIAARSTGGRRRSVLGLGMPRSPDLSIGVSSQRFSASSCPSVELGLNLGGC